MSGVGRLNPTAVEEATKINSQWTVLGIWWSGQRTHTPRPGEHGYLSPPEGIGRLPGDPDSRSTWSTRSKPDQGRHSRRELLQSRRLNSGSSPRRSARAANLGQEVGPRGCAGGFETRNHARALGNRARELAARRHVSCQDHNGHHSRHAAMGRHKFVKVSTGRADEGQGACC